MIYFCLIHLFLFTVCLCCLFFIAKDSQQLINECVTLVAASLRLGVGMNNCRLNNNGGGDGDSGGERGPDGGSL